MNTAAIVISFAAAFHFALGQVLTQFGLRHVSPLSGAAISIPTFTLVFICASPILLRNETIVWSAVPIFMDRPTRLRHMMMLEKNSDHIAALMLEWIEKTVPPKP